MNKILLVSIMVVAAFAATAARADDERSTTGDVAITDSGALDNKNGPVIVEEYRQPARNYDLTLAPHDDGIIIDGSSGAGGGESGIGYEVQSEDGEPASEPAQE